MKSIDRLRKYGARFNNSHDAWSGIGTEILEFADEIEHDVDDMWHAMTIDAKPMTDENMAKSGWVRLPVDAEGVPIHVGDVMEWPYGNGEFRVNGIGGNTLFYIDKDSGECEWTAAGDKHHHHAPTVEDVLDEFASAYDRIGGEDEEHQLYLNLIAEYAAKLRLAGEDA